MPTKKRTFSRRLRISNLSSTAQEDDATPSVAETNPEPPNPYKTMRVAECRLNLLDKDNEIERLKLALKVSQQESFSRNATIDEKKATLQKMSNQSC